MADDKLKIDSEGTFYKWQTVLEMEGEVQPPEGAVASTATTGRLPGFDIEKMLRAYMNKKVRIKVEVRKE